MPKREPILRLPLRSFFTLVRGLTVLVSAVSSVSSAQIPGPTGAPKPPPGLEQTFLAHVDIRDMSTTDIVNTIYLHDLQVNRSVERAQCGLFSGEDFPICSECPAGSNEDLMRSLRPILSEKSHSDWYAEWSSIHHLDQIDPPKLATLKVDHFIDRDVRLDEFTEHLKNGPLHGEDYLFMNRLMLKTAELELAYSGQACIAPSSELPAPPVSGSKNKKSLLLAQRSLAALRSKFQKLRDPLFLKRIDLNNLGNAVETFVQDDLVPFYKRAHHVDLSAERSAPLNVDFWKVHSLTDALIGLWLKAHGYREISLICSDRPNCYQWRGTWVGRYPVLSDGQPAKSTF